MITSVKQMIVVIVIAVFMVYHRFQCLQIRVKAMIVQQMMLVTAIAVFIVCPFCLY